MTPCQRSSVSIQGFALGELPMCRCDSIPSPSTSPTLGPGHDDYSLQRICSDPIIGSDFWIAFTEVPSTGWRPRYLAIAAHHPGGPLTVQPPHACVTGYLYPVPGVVFTHTGNFAVFRVPLPLNPALVGQQFRVQGASRSPTSGCHRFTDGILVTIRP
jgi:hypothetical protein